MDAGTALCANAITLFSIGGTMGTIMASLTTLIRRISGPALAVGMALSAAPAHAFDGASAFIHTNATTCEVGIGFDWSTTQLRVGAVQEVGSSVGSGDIVSTTTGGAMRSLGLATQSIASATRVMDELVAAIPNASSDCEAGLATPTGTLGDFFADFPEGEYPFTETDIFFATSETTATLTHVIPAAPSITFPAPGQKVDRRGLVVRWDAVKTLIPTFPDAFAGSGITDADVDIVGFQVRVDRLTLNGVAAPKTILIAEPRDRRHRMRLPRVITDPNSEYAVTVTQIDASGNRTSATVPFSTK